MNYNAKNMSAHSIRIRRRRYPQLEHSSSGKTLVLSGNSRQVVKVKRQLAAGLVRG